jgi:hypothetical protein
LPPTLVAFIVMPSFLFVSPVPSYSGVFVEVGGDHQRGTR